MLSRGFLNHNLALADKSIKLPSRLFSRQLLNAIATAAARRLGEDRVESLDERLIRRTIRMAQIDIITSEKLAVCFVEKTFILDDTCSLRCIASKHHGVILVLRRERITYRGIALAIKTEIHIVEPRRSTFAVAVDEIKQDGERGSTATLRHRSRKTENVFPLNCKKTTKTH